VPEGKRVDRWEAGRIVHAAALGSLGRMSERQTIHSVTLRLRADPFGRGFVAGGGFFCVAATLWIVAWPAVKIDEAVDGVLALLCASVSCGIFAYLKLGLTTVTLASDGVRKHGVFGSRFIAWRDVVEVVPLLDAFRPLGIRLVARDGRGMNLEASGDQYLELRERLEEDRRNFEARIVSGLDPDLFARKGLSVEAWRVRVAEVVGAGGSFRTAEIRLEDVVCVLEDPGADAEVRVGAALALAALEPVKAARIVGLTAHHVGEDRLRAALVEATEREPDEEVLDSVTSSAG
jgi:hypothetical protein